MLGGRFLATKGQRGLLPWDPSIYSGGLAVWSPLWTKTSLHHPAFGPRGLNSSLRDHRDYALLSKLARVSASSLPSSNFNPRVSMRWTRYRDVHAWPALSRGGSQLNVLGVSRSSSSAGYSTSTKKEFVPVVYRSAPLYPAKEFSESTDSRSAQHPVTPFGGGRHGYRSVVPSRQQRPVSLPVLAAIGKVQAALLTDTSRPILVSHAPLRRGLSLPRERGNLDFTSPTGFAPAPATLSPRQVMMEADGGSRLDKENFNLTQAGANASHSGSIIIDGSELGSWLIRHFADELLRSSTGATGPDARITPPSPGSALAF